MTRQTGWMILSLVALVAFGCGGGGSSNSLGSNAGGQPLGPISRAIITPTNPTLEVNQSLILTALASDTHGTGIGSQNWTWVSSNTAVVSIDPNGDHASIQGKSVGTSTITATETKTQVVSAILVTIVAPGGTGNTGGTPGVGTGGNGTGSGGSGGTGSGNPNTPPAGSPGNVGNPANGGTGSGGVQVYNNDFTGVIGPEWSKKTVSTTPGSAKHPATKFLGQFAADTVSLSLNSLPVHTGVTIEFDLFIIQSMDGNTTTLGFGPDVWDLSVAGGPTLVHTTFSNTSPASNGFQFPNDKFQAYPDAFPGGVHTYQTGAAEANTLGYTFQFTAAGVTSPEDAVYHLKYTFPHTGSAIQFLFNSKQTQAIGDEGWGLKNVKVTANP